MQEQAFWQAVSDRNKEYDGVFVYAVRSTGIYCRPSCPSRRPRREQVQFFDRPAAAEQGRIPRLPSLPSAESNCRGSQS